MPDEDACSAAATEDLRLYRAYFEASASGIFVYESDGRLLDVNSAACRMYGFSRKQMLAMDPREFLAPESHHVFDAFLRTLSTGEPFIGEARGLRRDGSRFDAEVEAHLITIGGRRYFFSSLIDITNQRRAEEERQHHADYPALLAEISSSLLRADPAAMGAAIEAALARIGDVYDIDFCWFWSFENGRRWVETHGWTVEPLHEGAADWPRVLTREDVAWGSERMVGGEVLRIETPDDFPPESETLRALHERFGIVSCLVLPLLVEETRVGAFRVGTFHRSRRWTDHNVEELRTLGEIVAAAYAQARAALRDSERRYRRVVEDQTEFIVRWRPDGARTFVNDAYCRAFGATREELVGTSFFPLITPQDRELVQVRLARTRPENPVSTGEHRVILPDGSFGWQQWTDRGIFDAAGRLVEMQSVGRDVTSRHRAEEELRHRAKYQTLVAELSSSLLAADPAAMGAAIEAASTRIGESYDIDFCAFWWFERPDRWVATQGWGVEALSEKAAGWPRAFSVSDIAWVSERICSGEVVRVETPDDFPPEAANQRALNEKYGLVSHLLLPLLVDETLVGLLTAGTWRRSRRWTDRDVEELRTLGEIVAAAHARACAQTALQQREAELERSQKIAGVGSYVFLPKEGTYLASPELEAIQGLGPDVKQTFKAWGERIHPDDRELALEILHRVLERESEHLTEYRIVRGDGTIRVVQDRGELERDEHGEAERVFGTVLDITERRQTEEELNRTLHELRALKEQLEVENVHLREEMRLAHLSEHIIGESAALQQCLRLIKQVATTDASVLLLGETGTGKGLIARTLHDLSGCEGPLVSVSCAALPANLIESELFGYEKGAFTGAQSRKPGRLELADRGTLFLDEIGELPLELQPKLLRALQEREFERVGGTETLRFEGRVVAATNRNLEEAVARGEFRSDLYYRLNVFPVSVPPLRERKQDMPFLAKHFAAKHGKALGRQVKRISSRMLDHMAARNWPGNIREFESFVQRALIVGEGPVLDLPDPLPLTPSGTERPPAHEAGQRLEDVEREHVLRVLEETNGVVEGERGAAAQLGLAPSTLRSRMKKFGIRRRPLTNFAAPSA